MHLDEGQLKAYLDHELATPDQEQVQQHLAGCSQCRQKALNLENRSASVGAHLSAIASLPASLPGPAAARARLQARLTQKEKTTMRQKIFAPRYRPAWIAFGMVLILAVALAFPPVQAIANSFLGLFRVQQFAVVQVNPGNLPEQLGSSNQLEYMFTNNVQIDEKGEPQEAANQEEASQLAGIPVRLPLGMNNQPRLRVMPGAEITFNIDLQLTRALLDEIGRSDIQLPDNLDGASVQVSLDSAITAMYGECDFDVQGAGEHMQRDGYDPDNPRLPRLPNCTTFAQMPSPSISAPPGLDVQGIGEAFLQVMGMPAQEAARFAQSVDWSTTLVIPIPRNGTTYQEVPVDGVIGTMIVQQLEDHHEQYLLIWVKDGILYSLTGPGNGSSAMRIVNSLN
ncbi:MAG: zf-HC2 domain-containing protein [Anaerolineales bacterium]